MSVPYEDNCETPRDIQEDLSNLNKKTTFYCI